MSIRPVVPPTDRAVHYYLSRLKGGRDIRALLSKLKFEPYPTIKSVLDSLSKTPLRLQQVFWDMWPQTYSEFLPASKALRVGTLEQEVCWIALLAEAHSQRLGSFLALRSTFERALLLDDFATARTALTAVHRTIGLSLWTLEAGMLLAERQGGLPALRSQLVAIRKIARQSNISFLADILSERIERSVTPAAYDARIFSIITPYLHDAKVASIIGHFRSRAAFHLWLNDASVPATLDLETWHSLLDGYLLLIRTLHALSSIRSWTPSPPIRDAIANLSRSLNDPSLLILSSYFHPESTPAPTTLTRTLFATIDAYTTGDYIRSHSLAAAALASTPACFDLCELNAKSLAAAGLPLPLQTVPPTLSAQIQHDLYHVIRKTEHTPAALSRLTKAAYSLDCLPFGQGLLAFCMKYQRARTDIDPSRLLLLSQSAGTPRFANIFLDPANATTFLDALHDTYPSSTALAFFRSPDHPIDPPKGLPSVPDERRLKHEARLAERRSHIDVATSKYKALLRVAGDRAFLAEDAFAGLFNLYLANHRFADAAGVACQAFFHNPLLLDALRLERLLVQYTSRPALCDPGNIAWPILFYAHNSDHHVLLDAYAVFTALDNFLNARHCRFPSDLLRRATISLDAPTIFLLRYICVPEVLDHSYVFRNLEALESERLQLCQHLRQLDTPNEHVYFAEITDLSRRSVIRRGLKHVDRSKVYVDLAGIRKVVDRTLPALFDRYRAMASLTDATLRVGNVFVFVSGGDAPKLLVTTDVAMELFRQMLATIHHHYVNSPDFGLDSYLSIRIRHGTISGQLRSPFEARGLVTRRGADGQYRRNERWGEAARKCGHSAANVEEHLARLSTDVDAVIDRVKGEWIQVRDAERAPDGMFDLSYTPEDQYRLYSACAGIADYGEFFTAIVRDLSSKTEGSLDRIRCRIHGDLRDSLFAAVDRCHQSVIADAPGLRAEFTSGVVDCKTAIQNEVDTVAEWFRLVDEREMHDFELAALITAVEQVVARGMPGTQLRFDHHIHLEHPCRGSAFAPLFDAVYILLDNAARHSAHSETLTAVRVAREPDQIHLVVENTVAPEVVDSTQARMHELERVLATGASTTSVRREGGTGFFKLHKILRHDLGLGNGYAIRWRIKEPSTFVADVYMDAKGIIT